MILHDVIAVDPRLESDLDQLQKQMEKPDATIVSAVANMTGLIVYVVQYTWNKP